MCAHLVRSLRPVGPGTESTQYAFQKDAKTLFGVVKERFVVTDIDQEVKDRAMVCMARIVANMGRYSGTLLGSCASLYNGKKIFAFKYLPCLSLDRQRSVSQAHLLLYDTRNQGQKYARHIVKVSAPSDSI